MSTIAEPIPKAVPADVHWRLSVDQYHAMIRHGILTEDDPVELLQGLLVTKMPKNPAHRAVTRLARVALEKVVPHGWYVDTQEPITTLDSEPEPDVAVVRGDTRNYLDHHPDPQNIALVVEVADSSLRLDRGLKKNVYAVAGIPTYWIANLQDKIIGVYSEPEGTGADADYRQRHDFGIDDSVPLVIGGEEVAKIPVRDFLFE